MTGACGPLLDALISLAGDALVLDGEIVLVGPDGSARPFQDSFSAIASKGELGAGDRVRIYLFDCLHRDGEDLLDAPLRTRLEALRAVAPSELIVPAARVASVEDAKHGSMPRRSPPWNEGVVVKDLAAPYRFGARGRAWRKVKEFTHC